ncbi:MAG: homoserine O-acetyltransferase [Phycisphaerae bacterium]
MESKQHLESSDDLRSAAPLQHVQTVELPGPIELELGDQLPVVEVAYETYGQLNEARDNAVLICHALSGDSHVARHDEADEPGWWDAMVGPGRYIDTDKYFVICNNCLGGCRGTTGPGSKNPATGRPYGQDFPTITIGDMVEVQRRLIDKLGIEKLLAVVGGSMGGHQALRWGTRLSDRVKGVVAVATSPRVSSQALAFDIVGRNAILHDPNFNEGQYYSSDQKPGVGLAIARMIGHITYLSRESMRQKFEADRHKPRDVPVEFEKRFSVGSYLGYQGAKFVDRFDANSYIAISMAMDLFDLGANRAELIESVRHSRCKWLVVSFSSDWLFSPAESREMVQALIHAGKDVSYCNVESDGGHDSFLLPEAMDVYGGMAEGFVSNLAGEDNSPRLAEALKPSPGSIFQTGRIDFDHVLELIAPSSSVLDLGCGNGLLLEQLRQLGHKRLMGVELSEQAILTCVRRGLNVIQADLNDWKGRFDDSQFDVVVLSRTLQAVRDVEGVVDEMLRVGRQGIVTFPNFAYYKLSKMLLEQGRAPDAGLLHHRWYNSPNIRFFSILDFQEFCSRKGITIQRCIGLNTEAGMEVTEDINRQADMAIVSVSR